MDVFHKFLDKNIDECAIVEVDSWISTPARSPNEEY